MSAPTGLTTPFPSLVGWPMRPGYFYDTGSTVMADQTYTTIAMTATRLYATPVIVPVGSTIDQLLIKITTGGAAGKFVKLLLYGVLPTGLPGALLDASGDLAADGIATMTYTLASPRGAGRYFACAWSDGAPTVTALTVSQVTRVFGEPTFGSRTLIASPYRDIAYGTPPNPFAATSNLTGTIPVIGVRAA